MRMRAKSAPTLSAVAARGDADSVRELLAAGADVDARDALGQTALIKAVLSGDEETVSVLLRAGADVSIGDSKGKYTALFHAAARKDLRLVHLLIDAGADMKQKDRWRTSAFERAVACGESVDVGLALMHAVSRARPASLSLSEVRRCRGLYARWVHSAWSRPDWKLTYVDFFCIMDPQPGRSNAMTKACAEGSSDAVRSLIQAGESLYPFGKSLLHLVGQGEWEEVVYLLLQAGASLEERDHEGKTVLHEAAAAGNLSLLSFLINLGADIDGEMRYKAVTALMIAVRAEQYAVVKALVDAGADIRATSLFGPTALTEAILWANETPSENSFAILKCLIGAGAIVNKRIGHLAGRNALMFAAHIGAEEVVKFLLDHGAQVAIVDSSGKTAIEYAKTSAIVRILENYKCSEDYTIVKASFDADQASTASISTSSIAAGLDYIRCLCSRMEETKPAWERLVNQLKDSIPELISIKGLTAYRSLWRSLHRFVTFYASQHPISRLLMAGGMMQTIYVLHDQLDLFTKKSGETDASPIWKEHWKADCERNHALFMSLLRQNDPLVPDTLAERQHSEALMLLAYECDKHKSSFTMSELYALHQYLQRKSRSSHAAYLLCPKWFIPLCEIELQYSSALLIGISVEYGMYCGMPVMIKCDAVQDYEQEGLFVQYVESWYELQHPGLLKFYGAYHLGNRAFMVYEKASFETLEAYLHRHNPEMGYSRRNSNDKEQQYRMVWRLMYQVAEALVYLHQKNISHGNLSTHTIIVDSDGNAKLIRSFRKDHSAQPYKSIAFEEKSFGRVIYKALILVDPVKNQIAYGCNTFIHDAYFSIIKRLWAEERYPIEDMLDEIRLLTQKDPFETDPRPVFIKPEKPEKKSWFNFKRWIS